MTDEPASRVSLATVSRSAIVLTGGTVMAQAIGIVRELFLAANVGVSADLDALLIAVVIPTTLAGAITTGAVRALVPAYMEAARADGRAAARRLAGVIVAWTGLGGLLMWLLLAVFAGAVIALAGPGLSATGRSDATGYLQLLAPVALVTTLTVILAAILQAEERFGSIALATLVGPLVTLGALLALWRPMGLGALAVASVLGPIATLAVLLGSSIRASALPIPVPRRDARLGGMIRHGAPITLGTVILQINVIGDRAIASLLGAGAVSALRYADVLVRVPIGAIGPAWGSAIYPALVRSTLGGGPASLGATSERALRYLVALFVPVAVLTIAVAPLAVDAAYGRGAFNPAAVNQTALVVAGFAPLLLILMVVTVLTGALNSRRRGQLLLVGGVLNVGLNIALDLVLGRWIGVAGIALASSIAQGTVAVLFLIQLARSEDGFPLAPLRRTFVQALLASLPVSLVAGTLAWRGSLAGDTLSEVLTLAVLGVVGMVGYVVIAGRLRMEEARIMTGFVARRLRRGDRPAA